MRDKEIYSSNPGWPSCSHPCPCLPCPLQPPRARGAGVGGQSIPPGRPRRELLPLGSAGQAASRAGRARPGRRRAGISQLSPTTTHPLRWGAATKTRVQGRLLTFLLLGKALQLLADRFTAFGSNYEEKSRERFCVIGPLWCGLPTETFPFLHRRKERTATATTGPHGTSRSRGLKTPQLRPQTPPRRGWLTPGDAEVRASSSSEGRACEPSGTQQTDRPHKPEPNRATATVLAPSRSVPVLRVALQGWRCPGSSLVSRKATFTRPPSSALSTGRRNTAQKHFCERLTEHRQMKLDKTRATRNP